MARKLKERKCKNRKCREEFSPKTEWQKYCSVRCRSAVLNRKNAALIRKGKLLEQQQEQQGAA